MFYNLDLKEWIIANMTMDMGFDDDIEWKDVFVTAVGLFENLGMTIYIPI